MIPARQRRCTIPRCPGRAVLAATLLAMLAVAGCIGAKRGAATETAPPRAAESRYEFRRVVMGVPSRLVLYAKDEAAAEHAASTAFARLAQLNCIMSDYQEDSELGRLCRAPPGVAHKVGEDLFRVLATAGAVREQSGGAFDIAIGPCVALWRRARATGALPSDAEVHEALRASREASIDLDEGARTATLAPAGTRLDLGGIAKGYAAMEGVRRLREVGNPRCLVALAGDIGVGDPPPGPDGAPGWRIAVDSGSIDDTATRTLVLSNTCVSTSGDAVQFIEIGGVRYGHIIDPRTGLGCTRSRPVTVVGPDGARADALATAMSIMDDAERERLGRANPGYRVIVHDAATRPGP